MNLAFCLFRYFPFGGLQKDFLAIAQACAERGHTVSVFTMEWQGEVPKNFILQLIPKQGLTNHTQALNFAKQCNTYLQSRTFDVVIGFDKMPGLDIYFAGDVCLKKEVADSIKRWLPRYRTLLQLENTIFSPDQKTHALFLNKQQQHDFIHCYQTPFSRAHLLKPGLEKNWRYPLDASTIRAQIRRELNIPEDKLLFLMVCGYFNIKGVDRTIKAVAALPENIKNNVEVIILGGDKPIAAEKNIHFLGAKKETKNYYLAADLFIHPARKEAAGKVLLEALSMGLPVITTDVCGYADQIMLANAGTVLASPFDQSTLNQALIDALPKLSFWAKNALHYGNAHLSEFYSPIVDFVEQFRKTT